MRLPTILPLLVLAGLGWFFLVSDYGSEWLAKHVITTNSKGLVVGKITSIEGEAKRIHAGGVDKLTSPLAAQIELFDGDRVETAAKTHLTLVLNSQDELELEPLTAVNFSVWNPRANGSPIYIQALVGEARVKTQGVRGKAYFVREGRLYYPGQLPSEKPMALTIPRDESVAALELAEGDESEVSIEIDDSKVNEPTSPESQGDADDVPPNKRFGVEPETLSNEYIDETITSRGKQFQKCWLLRLKDNPDLKGRITLQFEISKRGRAQGVRATESTVDDEALVRCVITVVERITFRPFKGSEISVSYPLTFE